MSLKTHIGHLKREQYRDKVWAVNAKLGTGGVPDLGRCTPKDEAQMVLRLACPVKKVLPAKKLIFNLN